MYNCVDVPSCLLCSGREENVFCVEEGLSVSIVQVRDEHVCCVLNVYMPSLMVVHGG